MYPLPKPWRCQQHDIGILWKTKGKEWHNIAIYRNWRAKLKCLQIQILEHKCHIKRYGMGSLVEKSIAERGSFTRPFSIKIFKN